MTEERVMRRIGDKHFLYAWQVIRAATQPDPECMVWRVGEITCRRYRHSLVGPDHRIVLDVVHVEKLSPPAGWRVVVTAENWWDGTRAAFRTQLWATHLAGSREAALTWFLEKADRLQLGK